MSKIFSTYFGGICAISANRSAYRYSSQPANYGVMARMTPEQAQQLLDAQKGDEKAMIFIPKLKTNRADRVFKDW